MLPLFAAPMGSVVNIDNYQTFIGNKIQPIIPRTVSLNERVDAIFMGKWVALSLSETEKLYLTDIEDTDVICDANVMKLSVCSAVQHICIDIANGHMNKLYDVVKAIRKKGTKVTIMVGNIANPETYYECAKAGVDYVRLSVGTGSNCITSSNVGIHYGIASLIDEVAKIKREMQFSGDYNMLYGPPRIVADGGVRNYSDIIKALALGADYVMCGSVFTKMWESAAETRYTNSKAVTTEEDKFKKDVFEKLSYGMSTKKAQKEINGEAVKTSEGIEKWIPCEYTMSQWVENFTDYLRSAMSYTNSKNLEEFKNSRCMVLSNNTINSINK
jgi:IMP dehydrogenase/GMP reductase